MRDARRPVVFVLPTLTGGGAESVVRAIADEVARLGSASVEVVSLLDPPEVASRTAAGVEVTGLGAPRVRRAMRPLLQRFRRHPPAAIVSTLKHVSISLGLLAPLLPRGTRHVARVANTYSKELELQSARGRTVQHRLIRLSHSRIDGFVCVSRGVESDLLTQFGIASERCKVIPNPVDIDRLVSQSGQPAPDLDEEAQAWVTRFLSVGRLEPQKDHTTLLRALTLVRRDVDAGLLVVGDGSLRSELEERAENLGIANAVRFVGYLDNPYPLFRLSDVLVLSSRFEGMPNVLLEALALGLVCVSTDCPSGPAEILTDSRLGALVPVGDPDRLAAAMVRAARTKTDRKAARAHLERHHSPRAVARAYYDFAVGDTTHRED